MFIGIDGSRAFLPQRTGIEEYSYQVIRHLACRQAGLMDKLDGHEVILYLKKNQTVDFALPKNWQAKKIGAKYLWTQTGLSWEMLRRPTEVLFVPAHTVPIIHPQKTVVVIHGLEYEFVPKAYSAWARFYMRATIKKSCYWAQEIIAVSKNTKQDLMELYKVAGEKIRVVYEGYENDLSFRVKRSGIEESNLELDPSTSSAADFAQDDTILNRLI
jgi:hypothetical protein